MPNFEPVIIRVFKSGDQDVKKYDLKEIHLSDMIMVFPTQLMSKLNWCNSYMTIGQHGDCDYHRAILPNTRPATQEEAQRMLEHYITSYGSDVQYKVYYRWQRWFDDERIKQLEEIE